MSPSRGRRTGPGSDWGGPPNAALISSHGLPVGLTVVRAAEPGLDVDWAARAVADRISADSWVRRRDVAYSTSHGSSACRRLASSPT